MAPFHTKFRLWIVLSVAFIPLSVLANPVQQLEGHRCYWCGPLAEQVHRSQRAAKCNGDKSKITICDEDLPYCAIVASSPPYVESRYCVKIYQDECYPLYCNSTKIWKVICPCRGELCNGPNTKRENEVFEALHKLTQSQRLKRTLISNGGFLRLRTNSNKSDNVTIEQNIDQNDNLASKEHEIDANSNNNIKYNITDEMSGMKTPGISLEVINTENPSNLEKSRDLVLFNNNSDSSFSDSSVKPEAIINSESTVETVTSDGFLETMIVETEPLINNSTGPTYVSNNGAETTAITNEQSISKETSQTSHASPVTVASTENNRNDPIILIEIPSNGFDSDNLKTDIIIMSSDTPKLLNDTKLSGGMDTMVQKTSGLEVKPMIENIPTKETKTNQTGTELEIAKSKFIDTAVEVLQRNDPHTVKTIELPNTSTTAINTNLDHTTQSTSRNNSAVRIETHLLTMVLSFVLQY